MPRPRLDQSAGWEGNRPLNHSWREIESVRILLARDSRMPLRHAKERP